MRLGRALVLCLALLGLLRPAAAEPQSMVAAANPITNEPSTLMISVPQGNSTPITDATAPLHQCRAMLPSAPPRPIHKYASIPPPFAHVTKASYDGGA